MTMQSTYLNNMSIILDFIDIKADDVQTAPGETGRDLWSIVTVGVSIWHRLASESIQGMLATGRWNRFRSEPHK